MKTYKLHLIRHGLTDANLTGRYAGCKTDLPLCPEGVAGLKALSEELDYPDVDRVYSGPLLRCTQTAGILYPDRDIQTVNNLTEYDFGAFEGQTAAELEGLPEFAAWAAGQVDAPPMGESNRDFIKRTVLGFNDVVCDLAASGDSSAAVIMHGGSMMMLLASCAVPRRKSVEWTAENGRGYTVLVTPSIYHSSGVIEVIDLI